MSATQHLTIGLLWHSLVSGNLGVGALTESNIAIIRGVAERSGIKLRFIVLASGDGSLESIRSELCEAGHDLECHRVRVFRRSFRDLIKRCDIVFDIGEGDSFADIYGFKRFFFYWLSKNIVCSVGKSLILAPQTIGPFDGMVARVLSRQVMGRCAKVFARDNLSTAYLKKLGITNNADESIDVAFRLPFVRPDKSSDERIRVGLNVSGLLFNGGYTGGNQFGLSIDYPSTMRSIIEYFVTQPNVEVHLVGHVIEPDMPIEDDIRACQTLAKEYSEIVVAPPFSRPSEAKSYIAGMDFFVGARMHACIAAFSAGVPVIPMAYSRKFNGLFGTLGYSEVADCRQDDEISVLRKVQDCFCSRREVAENIQISLACVTERIGRYELAINRVLVSGLGIGT